MRAVKRPGPVQVPEFDPERERKVFQALFLPLDWSAFILTAVPWPLVPAIWLRTKNNRHQSLEGMGQQLAIEESIKFAFGQLLRLHFAWGETFQTVSYVWLILLFLWSLIKYSVIILLILHMYCMCPSILLCPIFNCSLQYRDIWQISTSSQGCLPNFIHAFIIIMQKKHKLENHIYIKIKHWSCGHRIRSTNSFGYEINCVRHRKGNRTIRGRISLQLAWTASYFRCIYLFFLIRIIFLQEFREQGI